jgi:CDP-4-dehydro-6-deoxyglucose reductase, E1
MSKFWPLMENAFTREDKMELVKFILTSDQWTNGPKVKEFEEAWSKWLVSKYSLYVSSGSTANTLLVSSVKELYDIPDGAKVLVPTCTWVTNISPVIQCNLEPVFSDVNLKNFSFDEDKLPPDTDIRIVFVTYLLGMNMSIESLKKRYPNAIFIEDICESHGVTDADGIKRGSGGGAEGSTFSFYYGHHMTTVEGGMVSTDNEKLYELMKVKRSHGMARSHSADYYEKESAKYSHIDPRFLFLTDGYNFRNTEFGAVLGLSQLKRLDNNIQIRKRNYAHFIRILNDNWVYVPESQENENSNYAFPIICKNPEHIKILKAEFDAHGIEHRPVVAGNLLLHPFLDKWKGTVDTTSGADILNYNGVYIGNSQFVTHEMIDTLKVIFDKVFT